jgi:hypothetical protein
MPDDANTLTADTLHRAMRAVLEARAADHDDFWARTMARHGVQQVRFSAHLPDDDHVYILAGSLWLSQPTTMLIPEAWRRHLPPLPRLLTREEPT